MDTQGRWTFEADPMGVSRHQANVTLYLETAEFIDGTVAVTLHGDWYGDRLGLAFMFGDPDLNNRYVYHKVVRT
jgi:hypothetical protein